MRIRTRALALLVPVVSCAGPLGPSLLGAVSTPGASEAADLAFVVVETFFVAFDALAADAAAGWSGVVWSPLWILSRSGPEVGSSAGLTVVVPA